METIREALNGFGATIEGLEWYGIAITIETSDEVDLDDPCSNDDEIFTVTINGAAYRNYATYTTVMDMLEDMAFAARIAYTTGRDFANA